MRQRIQRIVSCSSIRCRKSANRDFGFIIKQDGMFSFSGLTKNKCCVARRVWRIICCFWSRKHGWDDTSRMAPLCGDCDAMALKPMASGRLFIATRRAFRLAEGIVQASPGVDNGRDPE